MSAESAPSLERDPILAWRRTSVAARPAHYLDVGVGRTAVVLHGWGLGHRAYRESLLRLASCGVRVLAPALPGFSGTAALPAGEDSLGDYAAWVVAFLDAVGVTDPVLLAGHSFGGGVAIVVAHDEPHRLDGLVLLNAVGGAAWVRDGAQVRPMAERPLWDWGVHLARDFRTPRHVTRVLPVVMSQIVPNLLTAPRALVRSARLVCQADLTAELEVVRRHRLPVVAVWARGDGVITEESFRGLCAALGDAVVMTVSGGHNWLLADPDRFGEVMTEAIRVFEPVGRRDPGGRARRWWEEVRRPRPSQVRPSNRTSIATVDPAGGRAAG